MIMYSDYNRVATLLVEKDGHLYTLAVLSSR